MQAAIQVIWLHGFSMDSQPPSPQQIQEQHVLAQRLGSIFMPEANRQMLALYQRTAGQTHGRLVHYTTAEAALNIIRTKRVWMRNTNCMSDYREVQHGMDIFNGYFEDSNRRARFISAFDVCAQGAAEEAIGAFRNSWSDIRLNTYITCVSEHRDSEDAHGRLSMWRAFGGSATRVGIVLSIPYISASPLALALTFSPVSYLDPQGVYRVIDEVIGNVEREREYLQTLDRGLFARLVFQMFVSGVVCLKHPGFHEEQEWRGIYTPNRWSSPLMESSTEVIGGVPQVIYKIPLDASVHPQIADLDFAKIFDRLIVGPTSYPWPIYGAFVGALKAARVMDAENRVVVSDIPIRA